MEKALTFSGIVVQFICIFFVGLSVAEDSEKSYQAKMLLESTGIVFQIEKYRDLISRELLTVFSETVSDKVQKDSEVIKNHQSNVLRYFSTEEFVKIIIEEFTNNFSKNQMELLIAWFKSDTGRRIVAAQCKEETDVTEFDILTNYDRVQNSPEWGKRSELYSIISKHSNNAQLHADIAISYRIAITYSVLFTFTEKNQKEIMRIIEALLTTRKSIIVDLQKFEQPILSYIYKDVEVVDLNRYAEFLQKSLGSIYMQNMNKAVIASFYKVSNQVIGKFSEQLDNR